MRLCEREAFFRKQNGVVTMEDMARARRTREAAERRTEEARAKATKKAATDGAKGLPLADLAECEVRR